MELPDPRRGNQYNRLVNNLDLYTAAQVRSLDQMAINEHCIPGFALMQRAANAAWRYLIRRWPNSKRLVLLCGPGNNGGDGFLLAQMALEAGLDVCVLALASSPSDTDAGRSRMAFSESGGCIEQACLESELPEADLYIDALYGSGLSRPLDGVAARLVEQVNRSGRPVLALDVPSGICADTGQCAGPAVRATATVSFVAHKRGLFTGDALDHCGDYVLDTLGLPDSLYLAEAADARLLDLREHDGVLAARPRNSHKGSFGHALAIGGDYGMAGAIRLSSEAALRVGAGLVSVATRTEHLPSLHAGRPELIAYGVSGPQELAPRLQQATVLIVGPGLGTGAWGHALWHVALDSGKALVLDADGLNLLARNLRKLTMPAVLTPHPGEAARLLGVSVAEIAQDRFAAARSLAARYKTCVVLKGAGSLVASPDGELRICRAGNPGMASAGMGDVLSGVIGGLMAQGLTPWVAAQVGVALHAQAGDSAAKLGERGLIATDLFAPLRSLVNGLPE